MPEDLKIRLEKNSIRSLNFKINKDSVANEVDVKFDLSYSYNYSYKEKTVELSMIVSIKNDEMPFNLTIEYDGLFTLNKRVSKKKIGPFCKINCPAILFPFLRECIADITRRAGFPPLILPSINFVGLTKKNQINRTKHK